MDFNNAFDIPEAQGIDEETEDEETTSFVKEMTCVNNNIPIEYKRHDVEFWKPVVQRESFKTVKHKFRKITSLRTLHR